MYHPNNTPPKHIVELMNDNDFSDHEDSVIIKTDLYSLVQKEYYYAIHKMGDRDDNYIILRDCSREDAIAIINGITLIKHEKEN